MAVSITELRRLLREALAREKQAHDEAEALYAAYRRAYRSAMEEENKSEGIEDERK